MRRKLITIACYAAIAILLLNYSGVLLDWMRAENHFFWAILIAVCFASIPILPYPVVGGLLGVAYGPLLGFLVSWTASNLASLVMFLMVRYGFRDWGQRMIESNERLRNVNSWVVKHEFATVLIGRMLPIMPSAVVNTYAAISGMSFLSYLFASLFGKIPANFMYVMVGSGIAEGNGMLGWLLAIYLMVIVAAWFWIKQSQQADLRKELAEK